MVELRIFSWSYFMFVYNEETICCNLALIKPYVLTFLAFFNNLRLKHGGLFRFETNQFYLVAIRPNSWKNTKSFGSHRSFTLSDAAFLC